MAKVMKINGETMKMKTPVTAEEVLKDHPGHVLLESEAVKHYGTRAKPLQPHQRLEPKRLYFLVVLPEAPKERVPRRVRSGVTMSAKDRLESLMLSRRSVSDLTLLKPTSIAIPEGDEEEEEEGVGGGGAMRVKIRLPKAEVERLMKESENEREAAEKIMQLCMGITGNSPRGEVTDQRQVHWNGGRESIHDGFKARKKRVSFMAMDGGGRQIEVTS
ncbi:spore coat protein A [Hibiscus syriacus]|uniref:Spore coat protein A n=1 Tax=Hibiscus syriacus TaxID=106335 RepID=A0A6A3AN68_HIBSY|nr:spore coat protein A [Hibiscus syriacus]